MDDEVLDVSATTNGSLFSQNVRNVHSSIKRNAVDTEYNYGRCKLQIPFGEKNQVPGMLSMTERRKQEIENPITHDNVLWHSANLQHKAGILLGETFRTTISVKQRVSQLGNPSLSNNNEKIKTSKLVKQFEKLSRSNFDFNVPHCSRKSNNNSNRKPPVMRYLSKEYCDRLATIAKTDPTYPPQH